MDCIKVIIDQKLNSISVWNDGQGIPIEIHKKTNVYVAEMIFSKEHV
jgi:DNA topoisomerase-2